MSLNLTRKSNEKENNSQPSGKAKRDSQAKHTFLFLFVIGLIGFICGYKGWSKVLDKHVKY